MNNMSNRYNLSRWTSCESKTKVYPKDNKKDLIKIHNLCEIIPLDYAINNVEGGLMSKELRVNKKSLISNFEYFRALFEMNKGTTVSVLDFGLDSNAVEECTSIINSTNCHTIMDYHTIMLMLEVCHVLQCNNQVFINMLVANMVDRLDRCESKEVILFCDILENNTRLNWELQQGVVLRMMYKTDPLLYSKHFNLKNSNCSGLSSVFKKVTFFSSKYIMLVVSPVKTWGNSSYDDLWENKGGSIGRVQTYYKWGQLLILDGSNKIVQIRYPNGNGYIKFKGMYFGVGKVELHKTLESESSSDYDLFGETPQPIELDESHEDGISKEKFCINIAPVLNFESLPKYKLTPDSATEFKFLTISNLSSTKIECEVEKYKSDEVFFMNDTFGKNDRVTVFPIKYKRNHRDGIIYLSGSEQCV